MGKQPLNPSGHFLGIDIGNTHTVIGYFSDNTLKTTWRIPTNPGATGDELYSILYPLLARHESTIDDMDAIMASSVVPPATEAWSELARSCRGPVFVNTHDLALKLVKIRYPRPHEVGTDRLLNSLAAFRKFKMACIVVDYGTATTFDCIAPSGEYLGGTIAPGILLAAKSLFTGTSKLPMVKFPRKRIDPLGKTTESAIQAGLLYGFSGLTDNIIENLVKNFETRPLVISTGGLSSVLYPYCSTIDRLEPNLTMEAIGHCYNYFVKEGGKT